MNHIETEEPARTSRPATLHGEIVTRLRDYVVEGHLRDGARVPERELCEEFGISRTPLREALKVLASEGLIELLPNRGARIKALGPADIDELFDLMAGLEALAGRLACERMTAEEFTHIEELHRSMYAFFLRGDRHGYFTCNQQIHEAILSAARNGALTASSRILLARLRRVRYAANLDSNGTRWSAAVREHELMLDALRRRAGDEMATILFSHLRSTKTAVLRNLGQA
ncbi:GntR family transcriptional regulator [Paracoccus laeviglucosivorans]|uniref:DNA-binding transcriptional regulator, GntR family n=1 Tax=Paracoccus laeviglucosivorans TaxID=1197861 RepID=A0A521FAG3_9RHOB|nr:GntR family transcriptional regulator [Paracoccus laeviglucosivorans]SMO93202.1 DNA-binding transcriptional regulator, GntR family [Paracoccus laeviglucosivorans]